MPARDVGGKLTGAIVLQQRTKMADTEINRNTTSGPATEEAAADNLALFVALPVIIVIFTAIIALLLLLGWLSLRSRLRGAQYRSVPTGESKSVGIRQLPYPPSIKISDPPTPAMSFHTATQLSDPTTNGSRYPFIQHKTPSQRPVDEKRPPRLRTRRKGNHKHGKGMHVLLRNAEPSPESDSDKGKKKADRSPSIVSLGLPGVSPQMYMVPPGKRTSQASANGDKEPEIFLCLLYNQDTASLVVKIERVVGLPFREDGAEVDAYVRLFFIPKLPELPQRRTSKTRTARRDSAPVFDEEIRYEAMSAEELINSTLHIQVLDYRSYGKHHILGQVDLPLAQVKFEKGEAAVSLPLTSPRVRLWSHFLTLVLQANLTYLFSNFHLQ